MKTRKTKTTIAVIGEGPTEKYYLKSLEGVATEETSVETVPAHDSYVFTSKIGDKLTVNIYKTGT